MPTMMKISAVVLFLFVSLYAENNTTAPNKIEAVTYQTTSVAVKHNGLVHTIKTSTEKGLNNLTNSTMDMITRAIFSVNGIQISLLKLFISLSIFIIGFLVGGYYKFQIRRITDRKGSMSSSTRTLLANLGYYVIVIISFFIALNVIGINLSSIALVAGALSVGIGFGLQNIVSNFVSGLILMFERSVKVGDFVELSDSLRGHIVDIRMRSTVLRTNSNINVIVPNQNFIQNNVINWTMNDDIKRFEIPFGVAYGTKPQVVVDAILNAVKNSGFTDLYGAPDKITRVIMISMGDSSINFELLVWLRGNEILYPKRTTSRFLILIYDTLYKNGIEIPFPQLDLHIKKNKEK